MPIEELLDLTSVARSLPGAMIANVAMLYGYRCLGGEVTDIVAIAEMTPGPLGLNCATFAGIRTAGFFGTIAANLGVLMPSMTLCLLAAIFFHHFKNSKWMQRILVGVRPACFAMVIGICITLSFSNYLGEIRQSVISIVIGVLDVVLLLKYKWTIPKVILFSAFLGLLSFGFLGDLILV